MLEGGSSKSKLQKVSRGTQTPGTNFLKPVINATTLFIGMAVGVETKNLNVGQATTKTLKSISAGNFLSLTDMHGNGLR